MKGNLLIALVTTLAGTVQAASQCTPHEDAVIDSEARCVDNGGISIGFTGDDGMKVACMQDKNVRGVCGPDGRLTRLRAYSDWFNRLRRFQDSCQNEGGTFAYQDSNFVEPQNETYCLQAVPEVGSNMFEEPLCNYRSVCPAVTVVCEKPCHDPAVARAY